MNIDLSGQVAIVTGAGRGIGKEIALVFARCGATVVLAARSADQFAAVAEQGRRRVERPGGDLVLVGSGYLRTVVGLRMP